MANRGDYQGRQDRRTFVFNHSQKTRHYSLVVLQNLQKLIMEKLTRNGGEINGKGAKAPFPYYFGGKSKAAPLLWSRFGSDCGNYVEPFLGSAAVWLQRPSEFTGWATLNDLDGLVVNFWRSVRRFPVETAEAACQPVFEADLHARHLALVNRRGALTDRLCADPDYCEPRLAGWWAWGACCWIGSGWCAGDGPWRAEPDAEGVPVLTLANGGTGVNRQLPHLGDGGKGVNRQLPHLGDGGTGVNRQLPRQDGWGSCVTATHDQGGTCAEKLAWVQQWFADLQDAFREARIACGDWERICSPGSMTRNGPCAVLLDPPYSQTGAVYAQDSSTVAHDVRRWCIANGSNPLLRIALCGHVGEHEELLAQGWSVETWGKGGGYQGADDRERIWFSPACRRNVSTETLFDLIKN
jgi:DNA adenine methylase